MDNKENKDINTETKEPEQLELGLDSDVKRTDPVMKATGPDKPEPPEFTVETVGTQRIEKKVVEPYFKEKDYVKFSLFSSSGGGISGGTEYIGRVHSVKCLDDDPEKPLFVNVRVIDNNLEYNEVTVPFSRCCKIYIEEIKNLDKVTKDEDGKVKVEERNKEGDSSRNTVSGSHSFNKQAPYPPVPSKPFSSSSSLSPKTGSSPAKK